MKKYMKKVMSIFLAVCLFCSFGTLSAFAAETDPAPVVIGEFDGLLKDCWTSDAPIPRAVANVRINSYATYDKEDGVQVKVKLYVPWYEFPKPEFTAMSGSVAVALNGSIYFIGFFETANGEETIESDVNTGVTGNSGNTGTVTVSGVATANNALAGGGTFGITYNITIP